MLFVFTLQLQMTICIWAHHKNDTMKHDAMKNDAMKNDTMKNDALNDTEIRKKIQEAGLRVTGARLLVYKTLQQAQRPLSHTDIVKMIQENSGNYGDQATIYRTLLSFTENHLTRIGSNAGGIARYELRDQNNAYSPSLCV